MDSPSVALPWKGIQLQILELLGQGLGAAVVASHVGVTESYISQLLSEEGFRAEVRNRRIANLQKITELDQVYHKIEAKAAEKLLDKLPFLSRPKDLLEVIKIINNTKRRGADTSEPSEARVAHVIEVRMPVNIMQQFVSSREIIKDSNNQIIRTGEQSLLTAAPTDVRMEAVKVLEAPKELENKNDTGRKEESIQRTGFEKLSGGPKSLSLEDLE